MAAEQLTISGQRSLRLTLALLGVAVGVTLYFIIKLQPGSAGAFAFATVWLMLPYVAMAGWLLALQRRGKALLPWSVVAVLVALGGLYVMMDAIYFNPDPQSAIVVMLAPVLQGIAFFVLAPLAWWVGRRRS